MKELYDDVGKIATMDATWTNAGLADHLGKLTEEVGEFAREVNKLNGRKRREASESVADITVKVGQEAADAIQCIMAITISVGVTFEELKGYLQESNEHYQKWLDDKLRNGEA